MITFTVFLASEDVNKTSTTEAWRTLYLCIFPFTFTLLQSNCDNKWVLHHELYLLYLSLQVIRNAFHYAHFTHPSTLVFCNSLLLLTGELVKWMHIVEWIACHTIYFPIWMNWYMKCSAGLLSYFIFIHWFLFIDVFFSSYQNECDRELVHPALASLHYFAVPTRQEVHEFFLWRLLWMNEHHQSISHFEFLLNSVDCNPPNKLCSLLMTIVSAYEGLGLFS